MAATVQIQEWNGATAGSGTDKTSGTVRFKMADNPTVDLVNPIPIPPSGVQHSFVKFLRLIITGGTFDQITDPRAYSDGANGFGTGVTCNYAVTDTYAQPVAAPSNAANPPEFEAVAMTDFFGATSGSPIDLDPDADGPFTGAGALGDFLVLCMTVASTAAAGVTPTEVVTFAFDEV